MSMSIDATRRDLLRDSLLAGAAVSLGGIPLLAQAKQKQENDNKEPEVTASEDLMREHGESQFTKNGGVTGISLLAPVNQREQPQSELFSESPVR